MPRTRSQRHSAAVGYEQDQTFFWLILEDFGSRRGLSRTLSSLDLMDGTAGKVPDSMPLVVVTAALLCIVPAALLFVFQPPAVIILDTV